MRMPRLLFLFCSIFFCFFLNVMCRKNRHKSAAFFFDILAQNILPSTLSIKKTNDINSTFIFAHDIKQQILLREEANKPGNEGNDGGDQQ